MQAKFCFVYFWLCFISIYSLVPSNSKRIRIRFVRVLTATSGRPGSATTTHSCNNVTSIPPHLFPSNDANIIAHSFYSKYTEAYGIPVISSHLVPDEALMRACYVLRFLAADSAAVRNAMYKNWARVGIIAESEQATDIPEHSYLDDTWNDRTRALGATKRVPISTAPEENILCDPFDKWYPNQDIMVHELNHAVHLLGASDAIPYWDSKLRRLYAKRKKENTKWCNTYALSTAEEFFSEATQSYFNVNSYADRANGREGPINTRGKLKEYDPELYALIREVFPCGNEIVDRCSKSRELENKHVVRMDCEIGNEDFIEENVDDDYNDAHYYCEHESTDNSGGGTNNKGSGDGSKNTSTRLECVDTSTYCSYWKRRGYCAKHEYAVFIRTECRKSCGHCVR